MYALNGSSFGFIPVEMKLLHRFTGREEEKNTNTESALPILLNIVATRI